MRHNFRITKPPGKITSRTPKYQSKIIDFVYPDHTKALQDAGLAPSILPTMVYSWQDMDKKEDRDKGNDQLPKKRNT